MGKMKIFSIICLSAFGQFTDKQTGSQFLVKNRSKCGDRCAKDKGKCHDYCENFEDPVISLPSRCDCDCIVENSRCLCIECKIEDRCPEFKENKRNVTFGMKNENT